MTDDSFPRQQARTRRFTLGAPRAFQVSPDGASVTFLRTKSGGDPVTCLWEADAATGAERLVADPKALGADDENLSAAERARRERVRETAAGVVSYATDAAHTRAVFALSGQVYVTPLGDPAATPRLVATSVPALDPRLDPAGRKVAYVHEGALRVVDLETETDQVVAAQRPASPSAWRSSSPPRRWSAPAATGGPPTATASSSRGSTNRTSGAGTSPTRPTRTGRRPRSATRRRAPRTPTCRCTSPPSPTEGSPPSTGTGPPSPTWSPRPGTTTC